ncbi:MAG: hypothetical protein ACOX0W_02170 [Sphaerochaetaceae bacterium]
MLLLVSAFIILFTHKSIDHNLLIIYLLVLCSLLLTSSIRKDYDYKNYFEVISFLTGILIAITVSEKRFISGFYRAVIFVCYFSVIYYILGISFPLLFKYFPIIYNSKGLPFRFFLFSGLPQGSLGRISLRNYGLFREPAVFVCYITFAFLLGFSKRIMPFRTASILILTIITTLSTTGFVVAIPLIGLLFLEKEKGKEFLFFLVFFLLVLVLLKNKTRLLDFDGPVLYKFLGNSGSATARFSSVGTNLSIFLKYPILGGGWKASMQLFERLGDSNHNTNTILFYFAYYGVIVGTVYLVGLISFFSIKGQRLQSLLSIFALLLALAGSRLVFDINLYIFIGYGIMRFNKNRFVTSQPQSF